MSRIHWRCRLAQAGALFFLVILPGAACLAQTTTLSGQVIRVVGPNEVVVQGPGGVQYQVRLRGTSPGPTDHPAAGYAQDNMVENLLGRRVTVTGVGGDANRLEGVLWYGNEDVNQRTLNEGLLKFNPSSADSNQIDVYSTAEQQARDAARGIWSPQNEEYPADRAPTPATPPPGGWRFRPAKPSGN